MLHVNRYSYFLSVIFLSLTLCFMGCGKETSAATLQKSINVDAQIHQIEEFLVSNPGNCKAYLSLGTLYEEKGVLDEALKAFVEASVLNPSSVDPLIAAGRILNKIRQYDEAISVFEKAIGINMYRMEAYYYLGIAYAKTGRPDNSMILWQGAIRKIKDHASVCYLKGLVAREKGNYESAKILFKRALELKPTFAAAHTVLESLYCSMGNYGDAYQHAAIHRKDSDSLFQESGLYQK
ncbi:MAG: tetratricopeptide repeat protein [Planctomycetes bacterium]|nr:tetratricopeptide repeat protein [Planctomycetota bacterium]